MFSQLTRLLPPLILVLLLAPDADAQTLRGRVIDAVTEAPVVGSIVKASGPSGELGGSTLTNATGSFVLTLPAGFPLSSLSVERIGYASQTFDAASFTEPLGIELRVASAPIRLEGIVARAESFCEGAPRDGGLAQTIWEEARKSLEITAISQSDRTVRFEVERYQRDLRPTDYRALEGRSSRHTITSESPYRSITVEQMTDRGWTEGHPITGMDLFAPDAAVLLTDAFASQHCFTAEVTDDAVLLHFRPNRQRQSIPELEGVLVLHPATSELVELRFRYVGIPELERAGHAGGEIAFFTAPNGIKVVRQWAIRAPAMSVLRRGVGSLASEVLRVEYVSEEGGRILEIHAEGLALGIPAPPLDLGGGAPGGNPQASTAGQVASSRVMSGGTVAELVIQNGDSRPFRVSEVQLRDCSNTAVQCGQYPVDVTVPAGQTRVVFRVRKAVARDPFWYEWDYRGESVDAEVAADAPAPAPVEENVLVNLIPPAPRRNRSMNVVTAAEISTERFRNALEFVQAMRPQWLRRRAVETLLPSTPIVQIKVYVDNVDMTGFAGTAPEEALRNVSVDRIETIEWVDGPSATTMWGTGHQLGAIVISTTR